MIHITEITDPNQKSMLCERTLRALPEWFGNEAAIIDYARQARELPLYAALDGDLCAGFVAIKPHTAFAAEVCVMGVCEEYHRQGIGRLLIEKCEQYCLGNGMPYLTVKTLDGSAKSEEYARTRLFYRAMGFVPIEVFPLLWDEANPCLLMIRNVKAARQTAIT